MEINVEKLMGDIEEAFDYLEELSPIENCIYPKNIQLRCHDLLEETFRVNIASRILTSGIGDEDEDEDAPFYDIYSRIMLNAKQWCDEQVQKSDTVKLAKPGDVIRINITPYDRVAFVVKALISQIIKFALDVPELRHEYFALTHETRPDLDITALENYKGLFVNTDINMWYVLLRVPLYGGYHYRYFCHKMENFISLLWAKDNFREQMIENMKVSYEDVLYSTQSFIICMGKDDIEHEQMESNMFQDMLKNIKKN